MIKTATESANAMSANIVADARTRLNRSKTERITKLKLNAVERLKGMKGELSGIAAGIASQVIEREVNEKDHEAFIDEFIKNVGEAS